MKKIYLNNDFSHFLHGGDYNPEQWIDYRSILDEDMRLMKAANCNEMTVGVFSWSTLEPQEGVFDFSFLDEAIEKIGRNGGKVVLATPTAAPPFWMAKKYPEILRFGKNGYFAENFGSRRHKFCYTSEKYREKVAVIVRKLAERYAKNPTVIAWHLDNELYGDCFCLSCKKSFREFLRNKYKTIENLNKTYWAKWSSGEVNSFDDVEPPIAGTSYDAFYIDWKRFTDHARIDYLKFQSDIIKSVDNNARITTNLMPQRDYDLFEFAKILDFASIDIYPNWGRQSEIGEAIDSGWQYDYVRTLLGKPFMLMESAPGLVSWMPQNKLQPPGICTLSSISAVAHGSDTVGYFQFRKCRGANEQYHGAIVDHEGSENTRIFKEVASTGATLKKIDEVCGTITEAEVALFYDTDNLFALDVVYAFAPRHVNYCRENVNYYGVLWSNSVPTDIINRNSDFSKYKLIIMPMAYMVSEELQNKIADYVKNGGTVFATYMLGYTNENALCHLGGFPGGRLKDVFGIWNEEIDSLLPDQEQKIDYNGRAYIAKEYCEIVHLRGAKALAVYKTDFYKDTPCLTVNEYGKGKAYYQTFRDTGDFKTDVIESILKDLGIRTCIPFKREGVSAQIRTDGENEYLFIENYSDEKVEKIALNGLYTDLLTEDEVKSVDIEKFGYKILRRKI